MSTIDRAAGTLPGLMGLTHAQVKLCEEAITEAEQDPVTIKEIIGALESVLHRMDAPENGPLGAVLQELVEWRSVRDMNIAIYAFKKGLQAGHESGQQNEPGA